MSNNPNSMTLLSDNMYTHIRRSAMIWLPSLSAFYITIASMLNLPYISEVTGVLAAINVLAGSLSALAQKVYNVTGVKYDGEALISYAPDGSKNLKLSFMGNAANVVDQQHEIAFRVRHLNGPPQLEPAVETDPIVEDTE